MARHMYESIQDNSNPQEKAYSTEIVQKAVDGQDSRVPRRQNNATFITPPSYRPLPLRTWFILMVITINLTFIGVLQYMVKVLPAGWTDTDGRILDSGTHTVIVNNTKPVSSASLGRRDEGLNDTSTVASDSTVISALALSFVPTLQAPSASSSLPSTSQIVDVTTPLTSSSIFSMSIVSLTSSSLSISPSAPISSSIPTSTTASTSTPTPTPTPTPILTSTSTSTSIPASAPTPTPILTPTSTFISSTISSIQTSNTDTSTDSITISSSPFTSSTSPTSASVTISDPSQVDTSSAIISTTSDQSSQITDSMNTDSASLISTSTDGQSQTSSVSTDTDDQPLPSDSVVIFHPPPGQNSTEPEPTQFWDDRDTTTSESTSLATDSPESSSIVEPTSMFTPILAPSQFFDGRTTTTATASEEITTTFPTPGEPQPTDFFDGRTSTTPSSEGSGAPAPTQFFDGRTSSDPVHVVTLSHASDDSSTTFILSLTSDVLSGSNFWDGRTSSTSDEESGLPEPTDFFDGRTSATPTPEETTAIIPTPASPPASDFFDGRTSSIIMHTPVPGPPNFFDGRTSATSTSDDAVPTTPTPGEPEPTDFFDGRTSTTPSFEGSGFPAPTQFFDGRTSTDQTETTPPVASVVPISQFFDGRTSSVNENGNNNNFHIAGQSSISSPLNDDQGPETTAVTSADQTQNPGEPAPTDFWDGRETINSDNSVQQITDTSLVFAPTAAGSEFWDGRITFTPTPTSFVIGSSQFFDGRTSPDGLGGVILITNSNGQTISTIPNGQPVITQDPITVWNNPTVSGPITLDGPPPTGGISAGEPAPTEFWDSRTVSMSGTNTGGIGGFVIGPSQTQGTQDGNGQLSVDANSQGSNNGGVVSGQATQNGNSQATGNGVIGGQITTLPNGQTVTVPSVQGSQVTTLPNGQTITIPSFQASQIITLANGQISTIPVAIVSQVITLSNGQVSTVPLLAASQIITLSNGQISAIPLAVSQVVTLPNGQISTIPAVQGNQGIESVVLVTSGQSVYYSTVYRGSGTVNPQDVQVTTISGVPYDIVPTSRINLVTYVYKSTVTPSGTGTARGSPTIELITTIVSSAESGYVYVPETSYSGQHTIPTGAVVGPLRQSGGRSSGLSVPTANPGSSNGTGAADSNLKDYKPFTYGEYFLAQYVGTFIAILYSFLWRFIDTEVQQGEPYYQMAKPEGAYAADTVCHTYLTTWSYLIPWKAAAKKQWAVFWSSLIFVLALTVIPAMSSLVFTAKIPTICFEELYRGPHYCTPQLVAPREPVRVLQGFLGLISILGCILLYIIFRRKPVLYASSASIASVAILSQNREFLADFQHGLDDEAWVHHQLTNRRYGLRHTFDENGSPSYGFVVVDAGAAPSPFLAHQPSWVVSALPSRFTKSYRTIPANTRSIGPDGQTRPRRGSISSTRLVIGKKKVLLRWYVLGAFAIILTALLGIILAYVNTSSNTIFERFLDSDGIAIKVVATVVGTIVQSFWAPLNKDLQSLAPFHNLMNRNQPARRSIALSYRHTIPVFTPILCFLNRDFLPFFTGAGVLLSELLTILLPSIPYSSANSYRATFVVAYTCVAIICIMLIFLVVIWVLGRDLKFTRQVETTAGLLSYICASKMMAEFDGLDMMSEKRRTILLDQMGKRYGLGIIEDEGGSERIAIDEEPLLRSI